MPGEGGVRTVERLLKKRPGAKILILNTYETDEDIYRTMLAGAIGYVLKDAPRDELILAIRTVASGQRYMSRTAGSNSLKKSGSSNNRARTFRVGCIAAGHANKEIADALSISEAQ